MNNRGKGSQVFQRITVTKPTFICSKSTTEILEEVAEQINRVVYIYDKDLRPERVNVAVVFFIVNFFTLLTIFNFVTLPSSVALAEFGQVNFSWKGGV